MYYLFHFTVLFWNICYVQLKRVHNHTEIIPLDRPYEYLPLHTSNLGKISFLFVSVPKFSEPNTKLRDRLLIKFGHLTVLMIFSVWVVLDIVFRNPTTIRPKKNLDFVKLFSSSNKYTFSWIMNEPEFSPTNDQVRFLPFSCWTFMQKIKKILTAV